MQKSTKGPIVFVGLSGGVDSSVAAARLQQQGYRVVGVFIKVWQPDWLVCTWEQERLDAMRVAARLSIPFLTCDAQDAYKQNVADYFIAEYQAGRTPNPDVMCNQYVKFGAFLDFALQHRADYIATGHYAQRGISEQGYTLKRGIDANKDQSYFLWTVQQEQLAKILLPVGDTHKTAIRAEAEKYGLPTAQKKDSQGICFLGQVDIVQFLSHYTDLQSGPVLNQAGEVVGEHQGALVYTTGQRHGFSVQTTQVDSVPHYVIDRDVQANTITVSTTPPQTVFGAHIPLTNTNWITKPPTLGTTLQAQIRYRQTPFLVEVVSLTPDSAVLQTKEPTSGLSAGQSCVLYDDDVCVGGGIIG